MSIDTLAGRAAAVTGSSRGIGKAICQVLAENGASVVVNYAVSENEALATCDSLFHADRHMCIRADVSSLSDVNKMFDEIIDRYGRLDILVNNAAWTRNIDFEDLEGLTDHLVDRIINTNIKGVFYCSRRAIREMAKTKLQMTDSWRGNIVNISSTAVQSNAASNLMYIASKAAVNSLTRAFAKTFGDIVRVNAIAPGLTRTILTSASKEDRFSTDEELTPLGRICEPRDIANSVFALITQMTFVNGQVILVDGGRILQA
jgi:NAD(P)-dependent dehydrogenase (short-subunit alcohol dehydrogenase family)